MRKGLRVVGDVVAPRWQPREVPRGEEPDAGAGWGDGGDGERVDGSRGIGQAVGSRTQRLRFENGVPPQRRKNRAQLTELKVKEKGVGWGWGVLTTARRGGQGS
eukprot:evm.model.scf_1913.2 EVM.evm.TU.scf_1913.2   scf_1913:7107-7418(-)